MADAMTITVQGTDRTHVMPYRVNEDNSVLVIDETAPGVATLKAKLYDLTNTVTIADNAAISVTDPTTPGHLAFQGYVTTRRLTIEANYRIWEITATDLNIWMDQKVVGAPDGSSFLQDPPGTYVAFDPNAVTQGSDAATVQWLFSVYAPDLPVNTTTYVQTLEPNLGNNPIRWNTVTLRQALDEVAALSNSAIRYWIDPDWNFHWTASTSPTVTTGTAAGPLRMLFPVATPAPAAPYQLTDGTADHITTFNYEEFDVEWDDQGWADSVYVDGGTGYTYNPKTKTTGTGGSGWVNNATPSGRQRILREPNANTRQQRDSMGGTALALAKQAVTRGQCSVTVNFGGVHCGQGVQVTATPAGIFGVTYMIQRVETKFLSGTGYRTVSLEWGDAPKNSVGMRANSRNRHGAQNHKTRPRRPATALRVNASHAIVGQAGVVRVQAQAVDHAGNPWRVHGQPVTWSVSVYDTNCNDVTATTGYSLSATTTSTNIHGMAWVDLTTANASGLTYFVTAELDTP